jgi:hypothetical protein
MPGIQFIQAPSDFCIRCALAESILDVTLQKVKTPFRWHSEWIAKRILNVDIGLKVYPLRVESRESGLDLKNSRVDLLRFDTAVEEVSNMGIYDTEFKSSAYKVFLV